MTFLSVVIPTFNRKKYLVNSIKSIIHQLDSLQEKVEVVIIDSGDDDTKTEIVNIEGFDERIIKYIEIAQMQNRSALRNRGVFESCGEYILFMDNDMILTEGYLKSLIGQLKDSNGKLCLLGVRKSLLLFNDDILNYALNQSFRIFEELPYYDDVRFNENTGQLLSKVHLWRYAFTHSFCVSKKEFNSVEGFNEAFGSNWGLEDIELAYRLFLNDVSFSFRTNLIAYHQPHIEQSKKQEQGAFKNHLLMLKTHPEFYVELFLSFEKEFDEYYSLLLYLQPQDIESVDDEFDLIFGSLNNNSLKNRLGILRHDKDLEAASVYVKSLCERMPRLIRLLLIDNAVSLNIPVYFNKNCNRWWEDDLLQLGYKFSINEKESYFIVDKVVMVQSKVIKCLLPSPAYPFERFLTIAKVYFDYNDDSLIYFYDLVKSTDIENEVKKIFPDINTATSIATLPFKSTSHIVLNNFHEQIGFPDDLITSEEVFQQNFNEKGRYISDNTVLFCQPDATPELLVSLISLHTELESVFSIIEKYAGIEVHIYIPELNNMYRNAYRFHNNKSKERKMRFLVDLFCKFESDINQYKKNNIVNRLEIHTYNGSLLEISNILKQYTVPLISACMKRSKF